MDPITILCSVITVYQLACKIGELAFEYTQSVRNANTESEYVIDEIVNFQRSIRALKRMLIDEETNTGGNRLENLKELIEGESPGLKLCEAELRTAQSKLENGRRKDGFKSVLHRLSWPLKEDEVRKLTNRLRNIAESIDRALKMDNTRMIRETQSTTRQIATSLLNADIKNEERQKREDQQETRKKIMKWLHHPDPAESHNVACHTRNKTIKTGRWLLDGEAFRKFRETPRSLLFLHGDSGCGKTVLCSAIIEELRRLTSPDTQAVAFWYYCKNDKQRTSLDNLVRALILQIVSPSSPVPNALADFWRLKGRETPKTSDLIQILQNMLTDRVHRDKYIVIDALDESDEADREELMEMIWNLLSLKNVGVRILVTSRTNTVQIEKDLGEEELAGFYKIPIERRNVHVDILAHVTERLQNDKVLKAWPLKERDSVKRALVKKAAGMFRWVDCQLQAIRKCKTPAELRKTLKTLPKDVHEQYTRELASIAHGSQNALKILQWLTYPQRKLQIEEVIDMIAVDLDQTPPIFDEQNKMWNPEGVLEICGSLVRVDIGPGRNCLGEKVHETRTLTTAHASVSEFLQTKRVRIGSEPEVRFKKSTVNLRMAETCLVYLRFFLDNNIKLDEKNILQYPFARYCAQFWHHHYREAIAHGQENINMIRLNAMVMDLFQSPHATLQWVRLCDPDNSWTPVNFMKKASDVHSPLYYAALLGLPEIAHRLIDQGAEINYAFDDGYGTPLVAASALGNEEIVSLLLENGADPNLSGWWYWGCPLAAAVESNQPKIVKMLLCCKDIDINCCRISFESELEDAERDASKSLNECFTLEEIESTARESMVYIGAAYNSPEALWVLLDEGADPNIEGGYHHTALHAACAHGYEGIVGSLLERGARVDIYGGRFGSALIAACSSGSVAIVDKLIDMGGNINYVGGDGSISALFAVCRAEVEDVVKQKGGAYGPALHATCTHGKGDLVELLLDNGADPNFEREEDDESANLFRTPLHVSMTVSTTTMLLDYGAAINTQSRHFGTALHSAIWFEEKEPGIIKLLINRGADVNAPHWNFGNPLALACRVGKLEVVKLLLENGALMNEYNLIGQSPIQLTICESHWDVFNYLMSHGGDPTQADKRGCTGLHYAGGVGYDDSVRKILRCELDINGVDSYGWSALHWAAASSRGTATVIKTLLEAGIDRGLKDERGRTALDLAMAFEKSEEAAILKAKKNDAFLDLPETMNGQKLVERRVICDGCGDNRGDHEPECLYHCKKCFRFELCFRCIEDKDIIHFKDHEFMVGFPYAADY